MSRLRGNEWNFANNAAALITEILTAPNYSDSPLGHAEAELTELRGARRLDLVIFRREQGQEPVITCETKVPWAADGRTPYNTRVVEAAHGKASRAGALYFITWNIRRVVVWKTDEPGVPLNRRVVFDKEIITRPLISAADLNSVDIKDALRSGVEDLLSFLHSLLTGPPAPSFLPLDRLFIANIEAALDFPIEQTAEAVRDRMSTSITVKREVERWMRDTQGWVVSKATEADNIERAARFTCYVLVNRLCFYNALRRKYTQLPRLAIANSISTGEMLQQRLRRAFEEAKRFTGNYETVFDGDYGDRIPFFSNETTTEWRELIRSLDRYDFAQIGLDVIGEMYEQLLKPDERHRFGQHYTHPTIVDLINSFVIQTGHESVLDPSCGGGTFLVRAYARKAHLDPTLDHSELLESIYGCDILNYACHLSIINLAIRDLIDDDNFPCIHQGDYLRYTPGRIFSTQPVRLQAGGLVTQTREIEIEEGQFNAIIGNPPYIQSRNIPAEDRNYYYESASEEWPDYSWRRASDIYCYFWTHSTKFLANDGFLALLTQAAWLDVDYGIPLQTWMFDNFRIIAILETEAEPWFVGARVATAVTILKRDNSQLSRRQNLIRFVQFRQKLSEIVGSVDDENERQQAFEQLRNALNEVDEDASTNTYRVRTISQADLEDEGIEEGRYVGSKWGRYLRSTETLYNLQKQYRDRFVPLSQLAFIQRGATSNCDSFFLVRDISDDALNTITNARTFREQYGVPRQQVSAGDIRIVHRRDGVDLALEANYLRPIMRTARDYSWFTTSHITSDDFAVTILDDRNHLSRLAELYIQAGEREGWHLAPSFQNIEETGGQWYTLREAGDSAPILFIKTMQYTPVVLFNDAELLANQRLYNVRPREGIASNALCAILNSTLFACERYAAVKALGREAAIDVEVFSARAFRTPDLTQFSEDIIEQLSAAMNNLKERQCAPLLEDALLNAGLSEAQAYITRHPVSEDTWPLELQDETRQEIDRLVLLGIGVSNRDVISTRNSIYNELTEHVRKLRLLELEAQINRRGGGTGSDPSARQLADEIWAHLIENNVIEPHVLPDSFFTLDDETIPIYLPSGRATIEIPNLFDEQAIFACRVGRRRLEFNSQEELDYALFLIECGVHGDVQIPVSPDVCARVTDEMQMYFRNIRQQLENAAAEITTEGELRRHIVREGIKRVTNH